MYCFPVMRCKKIYADRQTNQQTQIRNQICSRCPKCVKLSEILKTDKKIRLTEIKTKRPIPYSILGSNNEISSIIKGIKFGIIKHQRTGNVTEM